MPLGAVVRKQIIEGFDKCGSASEVRRRLLADGVGVSYESVRNVLKSEGIDLKLRQTGIKRFPERDVMVTKGLSLQEIADKVGVSRQAIAQYIKNSGKYSDYRAERERLRLERLRETVLRDRISASFRAHVRAASFALHYLYSEDFGWAGAKAFEYYLNRKYTCPVLIPFDNLVLLFEGYKLSVDAGETPNLDDLAVYSDLRYGSVAQRILNSVGLSALNEHGKLRLSSERRNAIRFAYDLDYLNKQDIAFFVGCVSANVRQYFIRLDAERGRRRVVERFVKMFGRGQRLTWHLASMIYNPVDEGFSAEETAGIVGVSEKVVGYALDNRTEGECIEDKLLSALRHMFPERNIDKPYLES